MDTTEARVAALALLKKEHAGVLSTLSPEGEPRARLLYYSCDDAFNIYFLTFANTRKVQDLKAFPKVAFTVVDRTVLQTLQIEGDVADITNSPVNDDIIEKLFDHLQMNTEHYAPLARFDRSDIIFYRLTPTWVRFGNFTEGHKTSEVLFELDA